MIFGRPKFWKGLALGVILLAPLFMGGLGAPASGIIMLLGVLVCLGLLLCLLIGLSQACTSSGLIAVFRIRLLLTPFKV